MEQNRPPQFKAKPVNALWVISLAVLSLAAAIFFIIKASYFPGIVLLLCSAAATIHTSTILTKPYILFSEEGLTIRRGLLFRPRQFVFTDIEKIERIEPDHFINISMKSGEKIGFSLSTLRKEDRIRFIFLIESDVNRLKINQQQ